MNEHSWLAPKEPVWILKNAIFIKGVVETVSSDNAICSTEEGALVHAKKNLIFQRNPAYSSFNSERWDLMDTDVLNEPEVLKTLKFRLDNKRIYTFIENSLLSVNPYAPIPLLYEDTLKKFYAQNIIDYQENIRDVRS
jgi:myosin heavy subunit